MKTISKTWRVLSTALVILAMLLALALIGLRMCDLEPLYVMSGSMEPAFPVGSLIFIRKTAPADIRVGDPITYVVDGMEAYVTHRVVGIESRNHEVEAKPDAVDQLAVGENGMSNRQENASFYFQTKGDANDLPDGTLVKDENVVGVPVLSVPLVGYLAHWLQTPDGRALGMAIAAVIVILTVLPDLLRLIERSAKKKAQ